MKLVSTHSLTYHTHCSPTHPSTSTYLLSLSFLAPSGPPLMFRASPQSRTVTFSWRPVDEQQQNGLITNYTITCTPPITINIPVNTNMDLFTVTHQGFTPVTQYSCSIIAMTVVGSGPSATLAFTTMDDDGKVKFLYTNKKFYHLNVVQCYTLASCFLTLRWRDTKINDIHDFTGYCYFHDKTELGGCFLHSVLLALSLGPD